MMIPHTDEALPRHVISLDAGGGTTMAFRLVPPGEFHMGATSGRPTEEPRHRVVISRAFWLGESLVTVDQIRVLIPEYRDGFGPYANELDWPDAMGFCEWVMTQPGIVAQFPAETDRMTLPSEAQWEYACRAGGDTEFHAGDGVPGFEANRWGFEGLHGELWQWCLDVWDPSAYCRRPDGVADPLVTSTAVADPRGLWHRSARGGSFESPFWQCRSAARTGLIPSVGGWDTGFRVCLVEREPWDVSD